AARGTLLTAASLATQDFYTRSQITPLQLSCCSRLKWLELELGRLGEAIAWYELDRVLSNVIRDYPDKPDWVDYDVEQFDAILAIEILKTELTQLPCLVQAPDALKERGLLISSAAALFALGHDATLPPELCFEEDEDIESFFSRLLAQPGSSEISCTPTFGDETVTRMTSHILGCNFTLCCPYTSPYVELGETILAALESVMATGLVDSIMAREPIVTLEIIGNNKIQWWNFSFSDENGRHHCQITCGRFDPNSLTIQEQGALKEKLRDLLFHLLSRAFLLGKDLEQSLVRLFGEDLALERSLGFTGSFVVTGNVLGKMQKRKISEIGKDSHKYEVKRVSAWKPSFGNAEEGSQDKAKPLTIAKGPAPADIFDSAKMKHSDVTTVSLIREVLWNKAGWNGTAFLIAPDSPIPPIMALLFSDKEVAKKIFMNLKKELGPVDDQELLRVSIIRGISSSNQNAYRVVIGANPTSGLVKEKLAFFVYRLQTMEPASDDNLKRFISRYERVGSYGLTYAWRQSQKKQGRLFELDWDTIIAKRELNIRDAWTIDIYDIDGVGIQCDDTPIVPEGVLEAPVTELLLKKKERVKQTPEESGR
ncbi:MAG TPA: hypothetical protein VMZ06_14715, partial [Candidatus Bathyarchaeia archaeon]|nr:hypothetical protein [Candidatus Bathyarchaeia archaeon]